MLNGHDGMLAVDVGGTNIRAGVVELNLKKAMDLSKARVFDMKLWRHKDEDPGRDDAVAYLADMLTSLAKDAKKSRPDPGSGYWYRLPRISVDMNGRQSQRIGEHELGDRAFEFGLRAEADQAQAFGQFHKEVSRAFQSIAPANVDQVLDNHGLVPRCSPHEGCTEAGKLGDMMCVPSTGLTTPSVNAEKEWCTVLKSTLRSPTMSPAMGNEMIWRPPLGNSL